MSIGESAPNPLSDPRTEQFMDFDENRGLVKTGHEIGSEKVILRAFTIAQDYW
jgi:hypothetical protein